MSRRQALIWSPLSLELVFARLLRCTCRVNLSKVFRGLLSNGSMRSLWMRSFFTFAVSSFQCASFEREEAVPNKPSERDRAIVHHSAGVWSGLSGLLGYFTFEYFARFSRFHLRLQPENYRDDITFLLIRSRVESAASRRWVSSSLPTRSRRSSNAAPLVCCRSRHRRSPQRIDAMTRPSKKIEWSSKWRDS